MKQYFTGFAIFCLAVSVVIGSWILSNGLSAGTESTPVQEVQGQLLTQVELAEYLDISVEESQKLGPVPDWQGEGTLTSEIPFIKIGEHVYYAKAKVDEWLLLSGTAVVE